MNKNRPIPPVTTCFFFASVSRPEAEKRRNRKKGGRGKKGEAEREKRRVRKRRRKVEEECKEAKWCSKKPASTLD